MKCIHASFGNFTLLPECFSFINDVGVVSSSWELTVLFDENEIASIGFDSQEQLAAFLIAAAELKQNLIPFDAEDLKKKFFPQD